MEIGNYEYLRTWYSTSRLRPSSQTWLGSNFDIPRSYACLAHTKAALVSHHPHFHPSSDPQRPTLPDPLDSFRGRLKRHLLPFGNMLYVCTNAVQTRVFHTQGEDSVVVRILQAQVRPCKTEKDALRVAIRYFCCAQSPHAPVTVLVIAAGWDGARLVFYGYGRRYVSFL